MWKYGQGFFHFTYVEPKFIKVINTNKLVKVILNACFEYFEHVSYLSSGTMLTVLLMSWLDQYQLQLLYPTVEHHPVRDLQPETSQTTFDMFDHSHHLLHILHKSFLCVSAVFFSLEIIKHNMLKILPFSSTFNIKTAIQKFTTFDKFLMHTSMTGVII